MILPLNPAQTRKRCAKCTVWKALRFFYKDKKRLDGKHPWCIKCSRKYADAHRDKYLPAKAMRSRAYRRALRLEVLQHYSKNTTPFCACCKVVFLEFLGIDHIQGGGTKHKREIVGSHLYLWLKKNNFPKGFRVLCHNCNQAYGAYGYCPHVR